MVVFEIGLILAAFSGALFMAWTMGANSAAPGFGLAVSAGSMTVYRGAFLAGVFAFLGGVLQSRALMDSIGKGLLAVDITVPLGALILISTAVITYISIDRGYPLPESIVLVGSVVGAGLGVAGTAGIGTETHMIVGIDTGIPTLWVMVITWLLTPVFVMPLTYVAAIALRRTVSRDSERKIRILTIIVALYLAYAVGANRAGLVVGPLDGVGVDVLVLLAFGSAGLLIGAWMGAPKIIDAVARQYAVMGPRRSIAVIFPVAIFAHGASIAGIPVSFNQSIITGIIATGMIEGRSALSKQKITYTFLGWIAAIFVSVAINFIGAWLLI